MYTEDQRRDRNNNFSLWFDSECDPNNPLISQDLTLPPPSMLQISHFQIKIKNKEKKRRIWPLTILFFTLTMSRPRSLSVNGLHFTATCKKKKSKDHDEMNAAKNQQNEL